VNALDRKSAPGRSADVTSLAVVVVSLFHVPFPVELVFVGVNVHNEALVDVSQDPAYTEISPSVDMDGIKASVLSLKNGRLAEMVSRGRFDWDRVEEMLIDTK
jgi:hypothetical protein